MMFFIAIALGLAVDNRDISEAREQYRMAIGQMILKLTNNVYIHEKTYVAGKHRQLVYSNYNNHFYSGVYGGESDLGGTYLKPDSQLMISLNEETKKYRLHSYLRVNDAQFPIMSAGMRKLVNSHGFLHSIPYYKTSVLDMFNEESNCGNPGKVIHVKRMDKDKIPICRVFFKFNHHTTVEKFDGIDCTGYFDLAPTQSWVILQTVMRDGRNWVNEFDGTINGVPKLKKVTDTFKPDDKSQPDRVDTLEIIKYENTNSVDESRYYPQYYGLNVGFFGESDSGGPPWLLFTVVGAIVFIALGGFMYRLSVLRKVKTV